MGFHDAKRDPCQFIGHRVGQSLGDGPENQRGHVAGVDKRDHVFPWVENSGSQRDKAVHLAGMLIKQVIEPIDGGGRIFFGQ